LIRVCAPWIKAVYRFDVDGQMGYIIPQSDSVVLGGTFQLNDWNEQINDDDTETIWRLSRQCLPGLEHVTEGQIQVGFRPYRDNGVRLEHETTVDGMNIVHCYGHSGSGVTLSWGCARDVVELICRLIPPSSLGDDDKRPEHEQLWTLLSNE
jgi:D-amino-acid oxidase